MQNNKWAWYVIQVISWTEENVRSSLFQRRESFSMEDYILDIFVPTHNVKTLKLNWQESVRKRNILPGYILINMIVTNESWYIVRNTPNVTWFLGAWNIPVPVSWEELENLKWKIIEKSQTYDIKFKKWDEIDIISWSFVSNRWIIFEVNDKKGTVKLNINLLWRDTPIELDFSQVKLSK